MHGTPQLVADALEAQSTELRNAVSSLKDLVSELRETRAAAGSTATIQELRDELRAISMAVNEYVNECVPQFHVIT